MQFHTLTLDNGLQIVAELNPNVFSVATAFAVRTGARDESAEVSGVSHFLEHMAFKGTEKFTAEDVNRIFDDIGADPNASTGDEVTQYHAVCLTEYLPTAFEVLADILYPSLRQEDFDMEKNVILEEIGMYADEPGWIAYEAAMRDYFGTHPLGNSILGSNDSITALSSEQMRAYHQQRYRAGNIVLGIAGNADWDEIVRLVRKHCSHWPGGPVGRDYTDPLPQRISHPIVKEDGLQEHIMQVGPAPSSLDDLRCAAELLTVIVGDNTGSRLFWELIDPGRADAADLTYNEFDRSGAYFTYLCSHPDEAIDNLKRIRDIYAAVNADGVTEAELEQAKNKLGSRAVLRSERPMGRLKSLIGNWMYRGEYRSVEDDLTQIQSVTTEKIRHLLQRYPLSQLTTVGVGPLTDLPFQD